VSDQRYEFAALDFEVDVLERDERALLGGEGHLHVFDLYIRFHGFPISN
jgi:hypothetical protein